ncbi:MAG: alanine racemase [Alistipes sp.]
MKYLLSDMAHICGGVFSGTDLAVRAVATDSRTSAIENDTLFVAIRGVNHDAHDYVQTMYERGVRAFMVERDCALPSDCGVVKVADSVAALQKLAAEHRAQYRGRVVAVTGSNGKTIVKEWIAQCAPSSVNLFRSPRSYNSQLGVALSLLMMNDESDVAVIEAGISQRGEMARLESMIRPDMVIFTSIGDAHQENFESPAEKIAEKLLLARNAGTIIYHSAYPLLADTVRRTYADRRLCDAAAIDAPTMNDAASVRNAQIVAEFFGVMQWPAPDFASVRPVAMRLEVKQGIDNSIIIDDTYNSDINSLAIALDYMCSVAGGKRRMVLILSDILQSGMDDDALYAHVASMVSSANVAQVVGVGAKISRYRSRFVAGSRFFATTEELMAHIGDIDITDSTVLLKGNRNSAFERISHRLQLKSHTTVLEVNLQAMIRNINYFRERMRKDVKLVAMVKASSYGSGDADVARMLQKQGVAYLAVAFADEGVALRENGITMPIVVLNADDASFDVMVANSLEPEIYSERSLAAFVREVECAGGRNYPVHIKFDTGMHRLGFSESEIPHLLECLDRYADTVRVASVFTHLCVADDASQDEFTRTQLARFGRMSSAVAAHLPYPILRHAAASAAILRFPEAQYDMCRLGLGLYGFGYVHNDSLEMVSTLRTRIVQIHELESGESVGYGRAQSLVRRSRIATIPVGYADGLDRHLGCGAWSMLVRGKAAPTVGRICMDSCMIDVTDIEGVGEGDDVVIFSPQRGNTPEDMARILDTICYEVLTSVSKRVKRIYINE